MFEIPLRPNYERQGHFVGIAVGLFILVVVVLFIGPGLHHLRTKRNELLKAYVPLSAHSYGGHEWITFDKGGLYHYPDCPCKATE